VVDLPAARLPSLAVRAAGGLVGLTLVGLLLRRLLRRTRRTAVVTVRADRADVARRWSGWSRELGDGRLASARVEFSDAPGEQGTEVRITAHVRGLTRLPLTEPLRRFKQTVETGMVPTS
jgi:hypothetical protein